MDEEVGLKEILLLLDEAGMAWLTDEVRQMRRATSEPSVIPEDIVRSSRTYDANNGDSPLEVTDLYPPQAGVNTDDGHCVEFLAARIEAIAGQLEDARSDAAGLGIDRVQLGVDENAGEPPEIIELLRALATNIRPSASQ